VIPRAYRRNAGYGKGNNRAYCHKLRKQPNYIGMVKLLNMRYQPFFRLSQGVIGYGMSPVLCCRIQRRKTEGQAAENDYGTNHTLKLVLYFSRKIILFFKTQAPYLYCQLVNLYRAEAYSTDRLVGNWYVTMEEIEKPLEEGAHSVTPESNSGPASAELDLIDLAPLQTENHANEQAADVMSQNAVGASALVADSLWEYTLLRENDRGDDAAEVIGAANDAANARHFLDLFRESFQEFRQSAEYGKLLIGEQAKWRPTLHDSNGRVIGQLNHVLLNPTLPQVANKPVVQIILPNRDYRQEVASRLKPDQQQAVEKGQPVALLERRSSLHDDKMVQSLMKMMTPLAADQQQRVVQAMTEYRQAQADTKPEDIAGLRQLFGRIVEQTLNVEGFRRDTLLDKMLEVNQLQRVTFHPDINISGKQPIHVQAVPLPYKGVDLQPAQLKNLLLGNTIEVAGLRDDRRPGLYRATIQFNVLQNKPEENSTREEVKTENKHEFNRHHQVVNQRGLDDTRQVPKDSRLEKEPMAKPPQDLNRRAAFRLGR
jgi:hypothetical protein